MSKSESYQVSVGKKGKIIDVVADDSVKDMRYRISRSANETLRFKTKESVKTYLERKYKTVKEL